MSNRSPKPNARPTGPQKLRHERGPGLTLADAALLAIFVTSLILIPIALFAMSEERGPVASIKFLLVGAAAAGAAYGTNKFAVDRLAPLHAIGYRMAGVLAVVGILLTGAGTALGSFTGIVFKAVEIKVYQEAGKDLSDFIGTAYQASLVAHRIAPTVEAVASDIEVTARCEVQNSCLSGVGSGGRGPIARELEASAAQAFGIVEALAQGERERAQILERLNRLSASFNEVLADQDRSMTARRTSLQSIHGETKQEAAALLESMPIGLLQSYANDLRQGVSIPGDVAGTRTLNAYLRDHGDTLAGHLDSVPDRALAAPTFPDRPGMLDVLTYLPAFLGIAAIVIVGELVLPVTLYFMTYFRRAWEIERHEVDAPPTVAADGFDGLIDLSEAKADRDDGARS